MEFNLLNLLMNRRSIRVYKDEKPVKEMIHEIINAGLLAPSSKNKRPVEFVVVEDEDVLQKLKGCKSKGMASFDTCPVAIVVIGDSQKSDVWIEDASIAATYMQLEAEYLGLGSVWQQIRKRFDKFDNSAEDKVRKVLNIPENYGVLCILSIGYKDEIKSPYKESDIDCSKVHYERF